MRRLLITGFGPFGDYARNASWESVSRARPILPPDWGVDALQVPVSWREAPERIEQALADDVHAVVAFGQARGSEIRLERIAVNATTHRSEDIHGKCFDEPHIDPNGPPAYYTGLPYERVLGALRREDVPSCISLHAGGYVCNFAFYHLMHHVHHRRGNLVAGFVHMPDLDSMDLETLIRGVEIVAREVADYADTRASAYRALMPS